MSRVLLLGMGPTALSALESLAGKFQLIGLIRDARLPSEGTEEGTDSVVNLACALDVPVFRDLSTEGIERAIIQTSPDCVVVSSYDRILPSRVLENCRFVNVHYAPLPEYRGRANVNWAIINGEPETAITVHVIAPGLDAGNILYQQKVPIGADDTVTDLYAKLNEVQRKVLGETVARYISGYDGRPQDESAATYGCTRVPGDGEINWGSATGEIYALIRALAPPYPGAYTYLEGRRISILRASPLSDAPLYVGRVPGRVVGRSRRNGHVDVLTGDGVLRIYEVKTSDSDAAPASKFVGSTRQTLGLRTADLLARIEALESRLNRMGNTNIDSEV